MKKICLLVTLLSFSAFAQNPEECFGEAVELSVAYKINALAGGDCSSLDREKYTEIEQTRQNKRRFLKNGLQALKNGENIPSRLFMQLDNNAPDVLLDKNSLCGVLSKTSAQGAKEIMQDCPEGAELFQWNIGRQEDPEKISDISLAHSCERVEKLKEQACRESKNISYLFNASKKDPAKEKEEKKVEPVKIQSFSGGAKATGQ